MAPKKQTKKSSSSNAKKAPPKAQKSPKRREIGAAVCLVLGIFCFIGYFPNDGIFIAFFTNMMKGLLGWGFNLLPPALLLSALILLFHRGRPVRFRVWCALLIPFAAGALYQLFFSKAQYVLSFSVFKSLWADGIRMVSGGALCGFFALVFSKLFSTVGAVIVFIIGLIFLVMSVLNLTISGLIQKYKERERIEYIPEPEPEPVPVKAGRRKMEKTASSPIDIPVETEAAKLQPGRRPDIDIPLDDPIIQERPARASLFNKNPRVATPEQFVTGEAPPPPVHIEQIKPEETPDNAAEREKPPVAAREIRSAPAAKPAAPIKELEDIKIEAPAEGEAAYVFPPVSLLSEGKPWASTDGREETILNRERLESTLSSFGVNSTISNIIRGPTVTRYETELEAGVKLNKLTNLADDIALSLGASGVRIAAIPNKLSTVGIEVPNKMISTVYLREIIDSQVFKASESKLSFAIGKSIGGEAIVGNIAKLPHLLVAGTTGSGKSVCLNSLILSILYKARPEEVKFIMIDPKMVEFKIYNGIPHLLVPVVTEAKKAAGALQWAVTEMMKRYRLFSETGARDLISYNEIAAKGEDPDLFPQPQIVVVIDELADLMLVAAKEVEESICRVAQMGRAAGVHLVIATQSPRADVITGLMKANIPSRISLKVSSALESRIILDAGGNADKLVGNGDMLYAPIGSSKPQRIQGTWVSDEEREKIVEFIKKDSQPDYAEDVIRQIEKSAEEKSGDKQESAAADSNDYDELFPQAVDVVLESGQASVSMLQRRLRLGYSRAARLVDQMEDKGIVGPFEGSKPRQLLITRAEWQEMQFIQGTAPLEKLEGDDGQDAFSPEDFFDKDE